MVAAEVVETRAQRAVMAAAADRELSLYVIQYKHISLKVREHVLPTSCQKR